MKQLKILQFLRWLKKDESVTCLLGSKGVWHGFLAPKQKSWCSGMCLQSQFWGSRDMSIPGACSPGKWWVLGSVRNPALKNNTERLRKMTCWYQPPHSWMYTHTYVGGCAHECSHSTHSIMVVKWQDKRENISLLKSEMYTWDNSFIFRNCVILNNFYLHFLGLAFFNSLGSRWHHTGLSAIHTSWNLWNMRVYWGE